MGAQSAKNGSTPAGSVRSPASRALVLMYHAVHANQGEWEQQPAEDRWYGIAAKQFEAQMEFVASGFETMILQEFLRGGAPPKSVVLTFDDGHESNYRVAFPLMQRLKLQGEFFVTTSRVGLPGYMTWEQLAELQAAGMSVQSHGAHHKPMTGLNDAELMAELRGSRETIETKLHTPVEFLSAPGGFVDKRIYEAALEAGYRAVCNSEPGLARPGKIIPRVAIMHSTSQAAFQQLVDGGKLVLMKSAARRGLAKAAKALLGVERYESVKKLGLRRSGQPPK